MAMIALKCPHIEVSEPRQRATERLFYLSLFFFPKEEREKILSSLSPSARTRAPEILLVVFLSISRRAARGGAFRSRSLFIVGRGARAVFLSFL